MSIIEVSLPFGQLLTKASDTHVAQLPKSQLRIDFILFSLPSMSHRDDRVLEGSDEVLGSDHCATTVTLQHKRQLG